MSTISIPINDLITYKEAAKILGVARSTIYNRIQEGKLHPIKIRKRPFLDRVEIERLKCDG